MVSERIITPACDRDKNTGAGEYRCSPAFFACCLFLLVFVVCASPARSAILTHSGAITLDTTWSAADDHFVTGDITVSAGVTLTLEPGVTVRFSALSDDQGSGSNSARSELIVEGNLVVSGTAVSPVVLGSDALTPAAGDWGGVRVQNGGELQMQYTTVEYATVGVDYRVNSSLVLSPVIENSIIRYINGYGIYLYGSSGASITSSIQNNELYNISGQAIYLTTQSSASSFNHTVIANRIHDTSSYGVYSSNSSASGVITVNNNVINNIQGYGISLNSNYGNQNISISGNTVYGVVNGTGIDSYNYGGTVDSLVISGNTVRDNERTGINVYPNGTFTSRPLIQANTVYGNGTDGTYDGLVLSWYGTSGVAPLVSRNDVHDNTGAGLRFTSNSGGVDVVYNGFYNNGSYGLYLDTSAITEVHFNNLYGNGDVDIYNNDANRVLADSNWWGVTTTTELSTGVNPKDTSEIYDIYDNGTKGTVRYEPWLTSALTLGDGPVSWVRLPADGSSEKGPNVTIEGSAYALSGIDRVEVSTDGGLSWQVATGTSTWRYDWVAPGDGVYQLRSRVITLDSQLEVPAAGNSLTLDSSLPQTSGALVADETWTGSVTVTGDITVPAGVILTIEPGTTIQFRALNDDQGGGVNASRPELLVEGDLVANGTAGSPIVLTSDATVPAAGDWGGIRMTGNGQLTLNYVTLEYATTGIYYEAGGAGVVVTPTIENSMIRNHTGTGIDIRANDGADVTATLNSNTVQDVAGRGVSLQEGGSPVGVMHARLDGNTIFNVTGSSQTGLYIQSAADLSVSNNSVHDTSGTGVNMTVDTGDATVSGNTVYGTGGSGIYLYSSRSDGVLNVSNNTIHTTSGTGLYFSTYYGNPGDIAITGNEVYGVTSGDAVSVNINRSSMGRFTLSDNIVRDNRYRGVYLNNYYGSFASQPVIQGNRLTGNGTNPSYTYDGLYVDWNSSAGMPLITRNEIANNSGRGLYFYASAAGAEVVYNSIINNGTNGIYLYTATQVSEVHFNNLYGNGGVDLYNNAPVGVAADSNWWGATTTTELSTGVNPKDTSEIYDIYDNGTKGTVRYEPWLTSALTLGDGPVSWVRLPADGSSEKGPNITIEGSAYALSGIDRVEVSTDGGPSWQVATGTANWSLDVALNDGAHLIQSRVIDLDGVTETPGTGNNITVDSSLPTIFGSLASDETWGGTINLSGDVRIPAGTTLTIDAGTTINIPQRSDGTFSGTDGSRTELIVEGNLLVRGTASNPVNFSATPGAGGSSDWYGIVVKGSLAMSYANLTGSSQGIQCLADNAAASIVCNIDNTTVQGSANNGISLDASDGGRIVSRLVDNTLSNSGSYGVSATPRGIASSIDVQLDGNNIDTSGSDGVYLYAYGWSGSPTLTADIRNNSITANGGRGIYTYSGYGAATTLTVEGNGINGDGANHGIETGLQSDNPANTYTIRNNEVYNSNDGIYFASYSSTNSPVIENNYLHDNTRNALNLFAGSYSQLVPVISGNTLINSDVGLRLRATAVTVADNNEFQGNTTADIQNDSSFDINAQFNWWGIDTTNNALTVGTHPRNLPNIIDSYDDAGLGTVDYSNWLTAFAQPLPPTLDPVTTPVAAVTLQLTGTKPADSGIVIDGATLVPVNANTTWAVDVALAEGRNSLNVRSVSTEGLTSTPVQVEIVRDTLAPRIISSDPANASAVSQVFNRIELTLFDDSTAVDMAQSLTGATVTRTGSAAVPGSWSIDSNRLVFTADSDFVSDDYVVTINPVDTPLGNTALATINFTVDNVLPAPLTVDSYPPVTTAASHLLTGAKEAWTAVYINAVERVPLDELTTWQFSYPLLEGSNDLSLVARDIAGNASAPLDIVIVRDTVAPVYLGVTPASGAYVNTQPASIDIALQDATSGIDGVASAAALTVVSGAGNVAGSWSLIPGGHLVFVPDAPFIEQVYSVSGTVYDNAGNARSVNTAFTYDATAPPVPSVDPVTSPTNSAVQTLTGSKEADAGIRVNGIEVIPPDSATTWSYDVTLTNGTNQFTISAFDRAGNQSPSASVEIYFDDVAPLPVDTLAVNGALDGNSARLDWGGYDEALHGDVAAYRIFISTALFTRTDGMTSVATVPAGQFTYDAVSLTRGTIYYFAVVAVDSNNNVNPSVTPVAATISDAVPPEDVSNVTVRTFESRLVVSWSASANTAGDLAGYNLYLDGAATPGQVDVVTNSFEFTGLTPATRYAVRISARDNDGNESAGVQVTGVTLLDNPAGLAVQPFSGMVELSWASAQPAGLVNRYAIYAATSDYTDVTGMAPSLVVSPGATTARLAGLVDGTTYYFAVTATNLSGGEQTRVTTVPGTPVADTTGPVISTVTYNGTLLSSGSTLTRNGTLSATAEDPAGVSQLEFYYDGVLIGRDGGAPYNASLSIVDSTDGAHTVSIRAYDSLDNRRTLDIPVTVAIEPPAAPVITSPQTGLRTSLDTLNIRGSAEPGSSVYITRDTVQIAGPVVVDAQGDFLALAPLVSGDNNLQAYATNRGGNGSLSSVVVVTRDNSTPDTPAGLNATAIEGGGIRLSWLAETDASTAGFNLYRSASSFSTIAGAEQVNTALIEGTGHVDVPAADGRYYYRVETVSDTGTTSGLSNEAVADSDRTAPLATRIEYTPTGAFDAASGRMGVGGVNVTVTVSEPLLAAPFLTVTPAAGVPIIVELSRNTDTQYQGFFPITETTQSGVASVAFSARDRVGNRGTGIEQGGSITIDTRGPVMTALTLTPAAPIRNDLLNPVTVQLDMTLDETLPAGQTPQISWFLSGAGRLETPVAGLVSTDQRAWSGSFTLPADAGLSGVENLQFTFSARDDLGNTGTEILAQDKAQVYQGDLPPLDVPSNLRAQVQPGGVVRLDWDEVAGALAYQVYRQAPGETALSEYTRAVSNSFVDNTTVDGLYRYAVASVRQANGQESISARSSLVEATADATVPVAPTGFTVSLISQGAGASWTDGSGEALMFNLYRSGTDIFTTTGLTPLLAGVTGLSVIDPAPAAAEPYYAVTAVDAAGNESPPSASQYLNADLLPVNALRVTRSGEQLPVLSWGYSGASVSGYNVYSYESGNRVRLNQTLLQTSRYTDSGYSGQARDYAVTAVDNNGVEGLERRVLLPVIQQKLAENTTLRRGVMNRLEYTITNQGAYPLNDIRLQVDVETHQQTLAPFSLAAGETRTLPVVVGGFADLPDTSHLVTTLEMTQTTGEVVELVRDQNISVGDSLLPPGLITRDFTRGVDGTVSFSLRNTSDVEVEIVTATGAVQDSSEIRIELLDGDNNVLASVPFRQVSGAQIVNLPGGPSVARIAPGDAFTSAEISLPVPLSAPDESTVRLVIDKLHYHTGQQDAISIAGVSSRQTVNLVDVSYRCEIQTVSPASSSGNENIVITGRAIDSVSLSPLLFVPVNLVIETQGFERSYELYTDGTGTFSYRFEPLPSEAGRYHVSCIHPDVLERPRQAGFSIGRLALAPALVQFKGSVLQDHVVEFSLSASDAALSTNVRFELDPSAQPGGTLPDGLSVTLPAPVTMTENSTVSLPVILNAAERIDPVGSLVLQLKSDETGARVIGEARIDYLFTEQPGSSTPLPNASPALFYSPGFIEVGISPEESTVKSILLENRGSADVQDIQIALTNPDGSPVSNGWIFLSSDPQQGDLAVGTTREIFLTISPGSTVPEGVYEYRVRILSGNLPGAEVRVFVNVTRSGIGSALFKFTDIYTATLDTNGDIIQGLKDAEIYLQNERSPSIDATGLSDEFGEALFSDLPSGWYKFRARAKNHQEVIGRVRIQPGLTASQTVFLDYNLVTVEWSVREITIEDRYEIVLNATYETDVPAPVVVINPASITLPVDMAPGDVFNGELEIINYGLIRAEDIRFEMPSDDSRFQYELLGKIPETLEAKQRVTIPYRVTGLGALATTVETLPQEPSQNPSQNPAGGQQSPAGSAGNCSAYLSCGAADYQYQCVNGTVTSSSARACWTQPATGCNQPGAIVPVFGGGGGGGFGGGGGGAGGGGGGSGSGGGSGGGGKVVGPGGLPGSMAPPPVPMGDDICVPTPDGNDCPSSDAPKLCSPLLGCRPLY